MTYRRRDAMNQNMLFANIDAAFVPNFSLLLDLLKFSADSFYREKLSLTIWHMQQLYRNSWCEISINTDDFRHRSFFLCSLSALSVCCRFKTWFLLAFFRLLIYRALIWLMDFTLACFCQQNSSSISMCVIVISRFGSVVFTRFHRI